MSDMEQRGVGGGGTDPSEPIEVKPVERPFQPAGSPYGGPDFSPMGAPSRGKMPVSVWIVAGLVVLAILAILLIAGRKKTAQITGIQPLDPYSANLQFSGLQMSESTSLSGGKSTYVDGHIRNNAGQTVAGITVQVLFRNDEGMPPQVETSPLMLIRTREPYVDLQTVGGSPLKPGDERDFRLIFESIPANWNQQMPEIHVIRVESK
jgi:hypothetical protein